MLRSGHRSGHIQANKPICFIDYTRFSKSSLEITLAAFLGKSREPGLFCQFECADSEYFGSHAEICVLHIQKRLLKMLIAGDIFYAQVYIWCALCSIHHLLLWSLSMYALSMICRCEWLSIPTLERGNSHFIFVL